MKVKFNKYERVAGLFVIAVAMGGVFALAGVAVKKGWFEPKFHMTAMLTSADGIHEGTQVQMAGLRAGVVTAVELKSNKQILVKFEIGERFQDRVRTDTVVRVLRPFIIGEKVLDVSVGSDSNQRIADGGLVPSEETFDVMDMISGRTLGPYLSSLGKMADNLRVVAEALLEPKRAQAIVRIFDELQPLLHNSNGIVRNVAGILNDVNARKQMPVIINNLVSLTNEMNRLLPAITHDSPQLAGDVGKIAHNVAILTDELQKAMPMVAQIGPELPRASKRAIEALDETVVTLKALQKSFLLRGNVEDVRLEEAKRDKASSRVPASAPVISPAEK